MMRIYQGFCGILGFFGAMAVLAPMAYDWRGYVAFGGEVILSFALGAVAARAAGKVVRGDV